MAKKRSVKLDTLEDLRAWLLAVAWPGWDLTLSGYLNDNLLDGSRHNYAHFSATIVIRDPKLKFEINAGSPVEIARKFQSTVWPQIQRAMQEQAEIQRRAKIAPPPMKRLTHTKPDTLLFT